MKDLERYQIAKEVTEEWREGDTIKDFLKWVTEKIEPVDPLKEKFKAFWIKQVGGNLCLDVEFELFKERFKEELFPKDNGTKGLDELKAMKAFEDALYIERIKKDLESK